MKADDSFFLHRSNGGKGCMIRRIESGRTDKGGKKKGYARRQRAIAPAMRENRASGRAIKSHGASKSGATARKTANGIYPYRWKVGHKSLLS